MARSPPGWRPRQRMRVRGLRPRADPGPSLRCRMPARWLPRSAHDAGDGWMWRPSIEDHERDIRQINARCVAVSPPHDLDGVAACPTLNRDRGRSPNEIVFSDCAICGTKRIIATDRGRHDDAVHDDIEISP